MTSLFFIVFVFHCSPGQTLCKLLLQRTALIKLKKQTKSLIIVYILSSSFSSKAATNPQDRNNLHTVQVSPWKPRWCEDVHRHTPPCFHPFLSCRVTDKINHLCASCKQLKNLSWINYRTAPHFHIKGIFLSEKWMQQFSKKIFKEAFSH